MWSPPLHAVLAVLASEEEPSKLLFYVSGAVLVAWAVAVSAYGIGRPDFPARAGARVAVVAVSVLLVAVTLVSVLVTS